METRICQVCNKQKTMNNFYKQKTSKGGYSTKCKICYQAYRKTLPSFKQKPKDYYKQYNELKLINPTLKDYGLMYKLIEGMGYNLQGDVAKQFSEKWGTTYSERREKDLNKFLYSDCNEKTPND